MFKPTLLQATPLEMLYAHHSLSNRQNGDPLLCPFKDWVFTDAFTSTYASMDYKTNGITLDCVVDHGGVGIDETAGHSG